MGKVYFLPNTESIEKHKDYILDLTEQKIQLLEIKRELNRIREKLLHLNEHGEAPKKIRNDKK